MDVVVLFLLWAGVEDRMSVIWEKGVVSFRVPLSPCFLFVCFFYDIISLLTLIAPIQPSFFLSI